MPTFFALHPLPQFSITTATSAQFTFPSPLTSAFILVLSILRLTILLSTRFKSFQLTHPSPFASPVISDGGNMGVGKGNTGIVGTTVAITLGVGVGGKSVGIRTVVGRGVVVGGTGVAVGGTEVGTVVGLGVAVGGTGVAVGGLGDGFGVALGTGVYLK